MNPVVNHLIQLQELALIRDEQKVTQNAPHLEKLDEAIRAMTAQLPEEIRLLFRKLSEKDHVVIGPVADGNCSMCGLKLPISLVQAVRQGKAVQTCPNCARMLYMMETAPRRLGKTLRRAEPKVGIARFSASSLMIPSLKSDTRDGVIAELAGRMQQEGFVDRADVLVEEALRREAIISTAVENGLAFPHVRGVEGGGLTLALGISRKGVKFDDSEKGLSRIIFFIVIPTAASAFYLKLLSGLTRTFMDSEARKELMAQKEEEKLWKTLVKLTRGTIK
ncbi:MAG: PTS sugar transporter subunit IIA [Kiritimatiellae bacterium]|nr:PTS sugar transporter subunit IIA [Kiritimatiellia bacterium]